MLAGGCRQVVDVLSSYPGVKARALVRDTAKGSDLAGVGAGTTSLVKGDVYQFASLPSAVSGCDAIVCCTGARDARDPLGPFTVDYQVRGCAARTCVHACAPARAREHRHYTAVPTTRKGYTRWRGSACARGMNG